MTFTEIPPQRVRAHELYGDFWFNSEPIPISALHGRVLVLFFWDYTCVNCLRALPYLTEWSQKYIDRGLVTIGVHTPKFPFGKNPEHIKRAIDRHGIPFTIVMDNEGLIAANYGQRSWPTIHLIDKNGFIRFQNSGEGNYTTTERVLQTLLRDAGAEEDMPYLMQPLREEDREASVCFKATPEIFSGYLRGSIGNVEGYSPESVVDYRDPQLYVDDRIYAVGNWMNEKNSLCYESRDYEPGKILLRYRALEVNAVLEPHTKHSEITITQDDQHLTEENKGSDVRIMPDGRSVIHLDEPRTYNIVKNPHFGNHVLQLSTVSDGVALYSFTCTSSIITELISDN